MSDSAEFNGQLNNKSERKYCEKRLSHFSDPSLQRREYDRKCFDGLAS